MPSPQLQNPVEYGWPSVGTGKIVPYIYGGYSFASGVASTTAPLWDAVSDLVFSRCTQNPTPSPPLTNENVNQWNFWGFEMRDNRNSPGQYSIHSWGLALDYNSGNNQMSSNVPPDTIYRLPQNMQTLLDGRFGIGAFLWGGAFQQTNKDWMHIECHMSPTEVLNWIANTPIPTPIPTTPPTVKETEMTPQESAMLKDLWNALYGTQKNTDGSSGPIAVPPGSRAHTITDNESLLHKLVYGK